MTPAARRAVLLEVFGHMLEDASRAELLVADEDDSELSRALEQIKRAVTQAGGRVAALK